MGLSGRVKYTQGVTGWLRTEMPSSFGLAWKIGPAKPIADQARASLDFPSSVSGKLGEVLMNVLLKKRKDEFVIKPRKFLLKHRKKNRGERRPQPDKAGKRPPFRRGPP
jgi:hypothetical protein